MSDKNMVIKTYFDMETIYIYYDHTIISELAK